MWCQNLHRVCLLTFFWNWGCRGDGGLFLMSVCYLIITTVGVGVGVLATGTGMTRMPHWVTNTSLYTWLRPNIVLSTAVATN